MFGQGGPGFGAQPSAANNPSGNTAPPAFGTPAFGATSSVGNAFGTGSSNTQFGSNQSSNHPAFGTGAGSSAFGSGGTGNSTTPAFGGSASLFGQPTTTTVSGVFGAANAPAFGSATSSNPPSYASRFESTTTSAPTIASMSSTATPVFGSASTGSTGFSIPSTSVSVFGGSTNRASAFANAGQPSSTISSGIFGSSHGGFGPLTASTPPFGTSTTNSGSVFGTSTATSGSVFGTSTTTSGSVFGTSTTSSSSIFRASTTTSGSVFRASTTTSGSVFGASTTPSGSVFGTPKTTATPIFGATISTVSGTGVGTPSTTAVTGSMFRSATSTATGIFAATANSAPSRNVFGASVSNSSVAGSGFGNLTEPNSESGQASVFGAAAVASTTDVSTASSTSVFGRNVAASSVFGSAASKKSDEATRAPVKNILKSLVEEEEDNAEDEPKVTVLFGKHIKQRTSSTGSGRERSVSPTPADSTDQRTSHSPDRRKLIRRPRVGADGTSKRSDLFGAATSGLRMNSKETGFKKSSERRRLSLEESQKKVVIVCKGIRAEYNDKSVLREHFSKYGVVKKVFPNPGRHSANIHFATHEEAERAKKEGKSLGPDVPDIHIFWASHIPKIGSDLKLDEKNKPSSSTHGHELKMVTSELNEELASMQGTADVQSDIHLLERPARGSSRGWKEEQPRTTKSIKPAKSKGHESKGSASSKVFKSGKVPSVKPAIPKSEKGPVSLKALANAVGHTAAERYEILENRDKIIRNAIGKPADFTTAKAIKGTCLDMCPERERYVREERRRLNVFEILPGTDMPGQNPKVNHSRAVKEYSRSSADQDMPLPNELRPSEVLSRTMDYLTNNIMDLGGDGKWGDWYEFLWDRTRSIRKDITQQQLCNQTAVDVTEKNVRFHIYCAERLCEEDMSSFDQKINNENLTKCLQTLKELYSDLEKKGTFCPREEEFRAYMVLMNLNEGDTLREVQQLRHDLRSSQAIRFATAIHSALNANNYVKFFQYVRQAPFLYACIMHRYFNQMRTRALQTMLKAYNKGKSPPAMYPISELVRLLCFESVEDASLFCQHHGLAVQNQNVALDRNSFIQPEAALCPKRAILLIEGKLTCSVGEVVNGGPLPPNTIPEATTSFDKNGRFIVGDIGSLGDRVVQEAQPVVVPQAVVQPTPEPSGSSESGIPTHTQAQILRESIPEQVVPVETAEEFSQESIKEVARDMLREVVGEQVTVVTQYMMKTIQIYLGNATWMYESIENEAVTSNVRELCREVVEDVQRTELEKQARRKAEISAIKAKVTSDLSAEIVEKVVERECKKIADDEYRIVQNQLAQESERRASEAIAQEILDMAVQEETCQVAETVFETDVIERLQQIEEARRATQLLVLARFWKRWRNRYVGRQRLKRSIQTFPPAPSMNTLQNQVQELIPESSGISHNALHLGKNAHATLDCTSVVMAKNLKLKHNITLYNYWKQLRHDKAWAPVNIGDAFYKKMWYAVHKDNRNIKGADLYWKLVLSLPDVGPDSSMDDEFAHRTITCCDWLRVKFRKGTVPSPDPDGKTEVLSLYKTPVQLPPGTRGALGVCVRLVKGFPEDEDACPIDRRHLLGTSAVLFYIGEVDQDNREFYLGEVQSRLLHVLESLPKSSPLPLILLAPSDSPVDIEDLNLDVFIEEGMISSFKVVTLTTDIEDPDCNKNVYDSLLWTTDFCLPPPRLNSEMLRDMMEYTLTREYFTPVYQNLSRRHRLGQLHQSPQLLIGYYNHLIHHVAEAVSDDTLQDLSWPVAEFSSQGTSLPSPHWNTADQLSFVRDMVLALQLPEYDSLDSAATEWSQALEDVWEYVTAVADGNQNNVAFFSKIKWILRKFEREFEATCYTCLRLDDCEPEVFNIPWTDIIQACVENQLAQAEWIDPAIDDDSAEIMVHYRPSLMESYKPPPEWLDTVLEMTKEVAPVLEETMMRSAKRKLNQSQQETDSPPKVQKLESSARIDLSVMSETQLEADNSIHQLNNMLAEEKQKNREFEDYLQRALMNESEMSPVLQHTFKSPDFQTSTQRKSLTHVDFNVSRTPIATQLHSTPTVHRTPANRQMPIKNTSPAHPKRGFSVEADIDDLNASLNSLRKADIIYEMRLKSFLTDT